ncbi:MAG: DUF3307 domain-containing protein [Flavisolibacter sp.]
MDTYIIWLVKIVLAHLLSDFILQPKSWVKSRNYLHFASPWLYVHGLVTGITALLLVGVDYWLTVLVIMVTHILIDGWKSYQHEEAKFFLLDQLFHLVVILACWYVLFLYPEDLTAAWEEINNRNSLILITAYVFVSFPAGIFISQLTKKWRDKITDGTTLGNAGKWIGIIERVIILTLVFQAQYEAIGLLIAAKSLLRFNEANRPEIKTEYLLIGTLISISLSILTGLLALKLINLEL